MPVRIGSFSFFWAASFLVLDKFNNRIQLIRVRALIIIQAALLLSGAKLLQLLRLFLPNPCHFSTGSTLIILQCLDQKLSWPKMLANNLVKACFDLTLALKAIINYHRIVIEITYFALLSWFFIPLLPPTSLLVDFSIFFPFGKVLPFEGGEIMVFEVINIVVRHRLWPQSIETIIIFRVFLAANLYRRRCFSKSYSIMCHCQDTFQISSVFSLPPSSPSCFSSALN